MFRQQSPSSANFQVRKMSEYITKSKQNLYDVALTLYGTIEGVFDLLVSNSDISIDMVFDKGVKLNYHENFVINQDVVNWLDENGVIVRNNKCNINKLDIYSEITKWIDSSNTALISKYSSNELSQVYENISKPNKFYDWDKWEDEQNNTQMTKTSQTGANKYFVVTDEIKSYAQKISGINFNELDETNTYANLATLFTNGMIVLPSDKTEKQTCINTLATPKILIQQTGKNAAINLQILNNSLIAIDWGDNSVLEFYHYTSNSTNILHTYSDDGEHAITIYGDNKFVTLDFSKVNGIHYALTEIYVYNKFVSQYPNIETLNKLFIIKDTL